jgi:hypothetical protein
MLFRKYNHINRQIIHKEFINVRTTVTQRRRVASAAAETSTGHPWISPRFACANPWSLIESADSGDVIKRETLFSVSISGIPPFTLVGLALAVVVMVEERGGWGGDGGPRGKRLCPGAWYRRKGDGGT